MLKRLSYIVVLMLVGLMVPKTALAEIMYLNINIAKSCGNWEIIKYQHCRIASGKKTKGNGGTAWVQCTGGGASGAGTVSFKSDHCGKDAVYIGNTDYDGDSNRIWQKKRNSRIRPQRDGGKYCTRKLKGQCFVRGGGYGMAYGGTRMRYLWR